MQKHRACMRKIRNNWACLRQGVANGDRRSKRFRPLLAQTVAGEVDRRQGAPELEGGCDEDGISWVETLFAEVGLRLVWCNAAERELLILRDRCKHCRRLDVELISKKIRRRQGVADGHVGRQRLNNLRVDALPDEIPVGDLVLRAVA
eukprot:3896294-Prymnesium_polylepis.1